MIGVTSPSLAANYDYNIPPGPETCIGILTSYNGYLRLTPERKSAEFNYQEQAVCSATIAGPKAGKWELGPKTAKQVLQVCMIGKPCRIEGLMKGFSHDIHNWVQVDKVSVPPEYHLNQT